MSVSGTSPSSTSRYDPQFWLLDALADSPSSFAASLVFIREMWKEDGAEGLSVDEQLEVVRELEVSGHIDVRQALDAGRLAPIAGPERQTLEQGYWNWLTDLASVSGNDVAYDSVGIWMALTPRGRREWGLRAGSAPEQAGSNWRAEFDAEVSAIRSTAPTLLLARKRAADLAEQIAMAIDFESAQERPIDGGVELTVPVSPLASAG